MKNYCFQLKLEFNLVTGYILEFFDTLTEAVRKSFSGGEFMLRNEVKIDDITKSGKFY